MVAAETVAVGWVVAASVAVEREAVASRWRVARAARVEARPVAGKVAAARVVVSEEVLAKEEERVAVARAAVGWAVVARVAGAREVEERARTGTALVDARWWRRGQRRWR